MLFENRIASQLLGAFTSAISGAAVARGVSFLKDRLEKPVFARGVRIFEVPHRLRGLGSTPFDDEGVPTIDRDLIADGVLDQLAAQHLVGAPARPADHGPCVAQPGRRPRRLDPQPHLPARPRQPRGDDGRRRPGPAGHRHVRPVAERQHRRTGRPASSGFWFEGGQVAYPVGEITVAGNLLDIYGRLIPASDLELRGSTNAPTLLVEELAIAGK